MVEHREPDIEDLNKFKTGLADTSISLIEEWSPIDGERIDQIDQTIRIICNNDKSKSSEHAPTDFYQNTDYLEQKNVRNVMEYMIGCASSAVDYQSTLVDILRLSNYLYRSEYLNCAIKLLLGTKEDTSFKSGCLGPKIDEASIIIRNYQSAFDLMRKMEEALHTVVYNSTNNDFLCLLQKMGFNLEQLKVTVVESSQHEWFGAYSNEISSAQCLCQFQTSTEEPEKQDMPLNKLNPIDKLLRKKKQKLGICFAKDEYKKHFKQTHTFADVEKFRTVIVYMAHLERKKLSGDSRFAAFNYLLKSLSSFTSQELNASPQLNCNMFIEVPDASIGIDRLSRSYPKEHSPIENLVSDPSQYGKEEDELLSSSEDSYCSHKSSDVSLEEESELHQSADDAISEFCGTDCYKLDTNLPRTFLEPNPSGPTIHTPTHINPKGLKLPTSLELPDNKSMAPGSRWLTETFHGPVRERLSQPPPEVTSDPLTRETTLENMRQLTWRLASMLHLRDFPVRHQEMADAGWFYDEDVDEFRCYCCPAARSTGQWSMGDDPASIHQTLSPDCPHFNPTIPDSTTQKEDARTSENEEDTENVTMVVTEDEEKGNEETFDEVTCIADTEVPALTDQRVHVDVGKLTDDCSHVRPREERSSLVLEFPRSKWDLFFTEFTSHDVVDMGEHVRENFEFHSDDSFRHNEEAVFHDWDVEMDGEVPGIGEECEALISPPISFDLSAIYVNNGEDVTVFLIPVQDVSESSSVCYIGTYENDEDSGNSGRIHHSHELFQASTDLGDDEHHTDVNEHSNSEYGTQGETSAHQGSFAGEQVGDSDVITTEDSDLMSDADNT